MDLIKIQLIASNEGLVNEVVLGERVSSVIIHKASVAEDALCWS